MLAEDLKNDRFWPQNHFFAIITPKPDYIYLDSFSWENFFKKMVPWDPPWGTWGPYLKKGSVKYFPNVFFWTSWAPWVSPYPWLLCCSSKTLLRLGWGVPYLINGWGRSRLGRGASEGRSNGWGLWGRSLGMWQYPCLRAKEARSAELSEYFKMTHGIFDNVKLN